MVFPCYYNAPLSYYSIIIESGEAPAVELYDHYSKQTYRNRCRILGANGVIDLVIPIIKNHGRKTLLKDVKIDYDSNWPNIHWQSIISSYSSAPFFEFFKEAYAEIYSKQFTFLADLNISLLAITLEQLQLARDIQKTKQFTGQDPDLDLSLAIHPKKVFSHRHFQVLSAPYYQVFSERHGFVSELSILDLLFNEGPNAASILKKSLKIKN